MAKKRRDEPTRDLSKPGKKISFRIPRDKGGEILVEGAWRYEGAELDFAADMGKLAVDLVREGKLWWDGMGRQKGPRPAPVPPPPPTKLDAALQAFNASRQTEKLELLMRSIGSAIEQAREHHVSESDNDAAVEALLGSALLSCQSHMKAVLHSIEAIRPLVRRRKAVRSTLLAEGHRTHTLLDLPSPRTIGPYSLSRVIWALAEFYKEVNQWPASWSAAKGVTKETVSIVAAAGIAEHTPHKLQTAVRIIGVSRYSNLDLLGVICDHWGNLLAAEIAQCGIRS